MSDIFKLECLAGDLKKALALVDRVVERRNMVPVLSCVRLEGGRASGTDLDIEISVHIPHVVARGAACLNLRQLRGLVAAFPAEDLLRFEGVKDGPGVILRAGEMVAQLPGVAPEDYQGLTAASPLVPVDGAALASGLSKTMPYISKEEVRYYLNGVYFDKDAPRLVATDGHKLRYIELDLPPRARGGILPVKAWRLVSALPAINAMGMSDARAVFSGGGVKIIAKLIDGEFPDYRAILPKDDVKKVKISPDISGWRAALRRMRAMTAGRCGLQVDFERIDGQMIGAFRRDGLGEVVEVFPELERSETPVRFAFNASYLDVVLAAMSEGDHIDLTILRPSAKEMTGPAKVRVNDGLILIMPCRVDRAASQSPLLRLLPAREKEAVTA